MKRAIIVSLLVALLVPLPSLAASETPGPTGTWFDGLDAGVCFDDAFLPNGEFDYSGPAVVVPCDQLHANEVVSRVLLSEETFSADDMVQRVDDLCLVEYEAFLGRPIGSTLMFAFSVAPTQDQWDAGAHDALCSVYSTEPILGTAASGSLRAPGETIAAYREVDLEPDLWLIDAGTGEPLRNITDNGLAELITSPSWTPDGRQVVFSLTAGAADEESDIYVVSVEDGTAEPLIEGPDRDDGGVFSPDGSTIAYISAPGDEEFEIFTRDVATGTTTRLTTYADRDSSPRWSPDGQRIAFRRRTDDVSDIWIMNADGNDAERLTDNGGNNYDPRWSPDGTRLAFTTDQAGNFDIGIVNADGTNSGLLTTHPSDDEFPTWSSDGQILAFQSTRQGGLSLWLMRADGSEQSELTGLAPVGFAMFAPGSRE